MSDFTVVSYFTPKFECFSQGLMNDCEAMGYHVHCKSVGHDFDDLIQAFDFKISFIREMVLRFGEVLWLDVECRIVRPIPTHWTSPLISSYETGKSKGLSSGVLMLDESNLESIDLWIKYAEKYPQYPDDFVLDFLANSIPLSFATVPLEFYDRDTQHPIARGLWKNENTIIQHPTINRWPEPLKYRRAFNGRERRRRTVCESISRQRKGIFYRNFGGDFGHIKDIMQTGFETEYRDSGWVFDAVHQRYAPQLFWPRLADDFTSKPRSFETSMQNFYKKPKGGSFRAAAMRKMRLDPNDVKRFAVPDYPKRSILPWRMPRIFS